MGLEPERLMKASGGALGGKKPVWARGERHCGGANHQCPLYLVCVTGFLEDRVQGKFGFYGGGNGGPGVCGDCAGEKSLVPTRQQEGKVLSRRTH